MLQLWGSARERSMIAGERARLRASVAEALARREAVAGAAEGIATVRAAAESAPRWSALIASLAETLPEDAFLIALGGSGDSLRLEGIAPRAAPVFDAVARIEGLRSLRPDGPIRQERSTAGATSERFTLTASLERKP
jgi:Tfp pilus assembly protein PilN